MGLKTKTDANNKKKNRAPEAIRSDDAPLRQHVPGHEEIKHRAHEIYLSQGATDGHDLEDWLQAERGLREANGSTATVEWAPAAPGATEYNHAKRKVKTEIPVKKGA